MKQWEAMLNLQKLVVWVDAKSLALGIVLERQWTMPKDAQHIDLAELGAMLSSGRARCGT